MPLYLSRSATRRKLGQADRAEEDGIAELSGERPRELGPWKSVGVEEEHEIAASGAHPVVERARLAGPTGGSARPASTAAARWPAAAARSEGSSSTTMISARSGSPVSGARHPPRRPSSSRAGTTALIECSAFGLGDVSRGALPASTRERARQHECGGELAGATDHHAASARGA
jgi:hypothetical protein